MIGPVPLGTNQLKIGAKLYNRHSVTNQLLFVVVDLDPAHEFPDGETLPAARVKNPTIGSSTWIAREKMNDFLVVQ